MSGFTYKQQYAVVVICKDEVEQEAIYNRLHAEINKLLAEGWQLKRQEVLKLPDAPSEAFNVATLPVLYAELVREVPPFPEEVTI